MARHSRKKHLIRQSLANQSLIKPHSQPIPVKGRNWKAILVGICGLVLILFLFVHVEKALDTLEAGLKPIHHADSPRLQAINQQMESLHGRFSVLLAESVEMKLKALSRDMEQGKLTQEDAPLFSELEKELQMLQQYSANLEPDQLDSNRLEHPRFKPVPIAEESKPARDIISAQFIELRNIVYFSLSALGVTLLALLGYWIKKPHHLPHNMDDPVNNIAGHLSKLPDD
jgi:hypothetical protein